MAPIKKSSSSPKIRSSSSSVSLKKVKGENFYRNAKQVARLKVLNGGKPIRDKDGKIIQAAAFQKGEEDTKPGRVQPDRRWFGEFSPISAFHADGTYHQAIPGSSRKRLWTTSEPVSLPGKMTLILSYYDGTSYP
jgi:hypothetical protein